MASDISIYSPIATAYKNDDREASTASNLSAKTLSFGVLDNSKNNADLLLDKLAELLVGRADVELQTPQRKLTAGEGATQVQLEALTACDVVLTGTGDCGSCCSWSVRDAFDLSNRGVIPILVCSDRFSGLADTLIKSLGGSELRMVVVPHPIGGLSEPAVMEKAEKAIDALVKHVQEVAR